MDNTELHYLTYDESAVWEEMVLAYIGAGGDILYPGDEKEMLLRGMQQIIIQAFAGIDNALRMNTLRYAVRDYLDLYGEKRGCYRIQATPATATVSITTNATGEPSIIPAGTAMTQDGSIMWTLNEEITLTGLQETHTGVITASTSGAAGNGLLAGMSMDLLSPVETINSITVLTDAIGGQNEESDEIYRERIRQHGLTAVTTGPADQYEQAAKEVSSEIIDAAALNGGVGKVNIYLLPASDQGTAALIQAVEDALNADNVRPLNDQVTVSLATPRPYVLNVNYAVYNGQNISTALARAIEEYQQWQDQTIGRAFNPDKLKAMMYNAGCSRVELGNGCEFDGGSAEYTEIERNEYCSGTITLAVINE